jgi:hypothetical protein
MIGIRAPQGYRSCRSTSMMRALFLIAVFASTLLTVSAMLTGSSLAADMSYRPALSRSHIQVLPFPRGERAQSVWASSACWSECGSYCAWGEAGCLMRDSQGTCLKLTDNCDRSCQRQCRTSGGPLLPLDF